jgi:NADH dehydrogenase FAD-containing subunit
MRYEKLLMAAVLTVGIAGSVRAAGKWEHPQEKKFTQFISLKGTVESIDEASRQISIKNAAGNVRQFPIDYDVRVLSNGERVQLSDVKPGENVLVRYLRAGLTVTSIERN